MRPKEQIPIENSRPSRWPTRVALAAAAVSSAFLLYVSFRYLMIQVDGGWYSYPGYALSLGRDGYSNQLSEGLAAQLDGLRFIFEFETTSSLRVLYMAPWFALIGAGYLSLKLIGLLELAALLVAGGLLYRSHFESKSVALLVLALLLTDKSVFLIAVSDSRPDVALAALSCVLYLLLRRTTYSVPSVILICVVAALTSLTHVTSILPIAFITVAASTDLVLGADRTHLKAGLLTVALATISAALAYIGRDTFFEVLLRSEMPVKEPVSSVGRVLESWALGPLHLLGKEWFRLSTYFLMSNVALLVAYVSAGVLLLRRFATGRELGKARGPLAGLLAAGLAFLLLDPHETSQHLVAIAPLGLLVMTPFDWPGSKWRSAFLAALVLFASGLSLAVGGRAVADHEARQLNNEQVVGILGSLFEEDREYRVIGPTELWPYFPKDRDVLVLDDLRSAVQITDRVRSQEPRVDYIVLGTDQASSGVRNGIVPLEKDEGFRIVVDKAPFLTIYAAPHVTEGGRR